MAQATLAALPRPRQTLLAACAGLALLTASGCGSIGDSSDQPVQLRVTADLGTREATDITAVSKSGNGKLLGVLKANVPVTQDAQGRLQDVSGLKASPGHAWAAYVNGVRVAKRIEDVDIGQGDRIWLDLQPTGVVASVPAAVGSFPAPFTKGYADDRLPLRVECTEQQSEQCDKASQRLAEATRTVVGRGGLGGSLSKESIRVLVGVYAALRNDETARQLELGPRQTGILARMGTDGRSITVLGLDGQPVRTLGPGSGLIAAIRYEGGQPTWIITGTDDAGVQAAADALQEGDLGGHFALAIANGQAVDVPPAAAPGR